MNEIRHSIVSLNQVKKHLAWRLARETIIDYPDNYLEPELTIMKTRKSTTLLRLMEAKVERERENLLLHERRRRYAIFIQGLQQVDDLHEDFSKRPQIH